MNLLSTARGIPPDVLLDTRNPFLPPVLAWFVMFAVHQPMPRLYWEFEVIWQAVSLPTWMELAHYLSTIALDLKGRLSYLSQERSYNLLSSEVRKNWKELRHLRTKVDPDNKTFYRQSGIGKQNHRSMQRSISSSP